MGLFVVFRNKQKYLISSASSAERNKKTAAVGSERIAFPAFVFCKRRLKEKKRRFYR